MHDFKRLYKIIFVNKHNFSQSLEQTGIIMLLVLEFFQFLYPDQSLIQPPIC